MKQKSAKIQKKNFTPKTAKPFGKPSGMIGLPHRLIFGCAPEKGFHDCI
jgi:hypothetical protein